jgi:hypothetical protein
MSKRRTHSPEFKAKVAMEAISGRKTLQEIAGKGAERLIQVSQWKQQGIEAQRRKVFGGWPALLVNHGDRPSQPLPHDQSAPPAPHDPGDLGNGACQGPPTLLGVERLLRPPSEDRDMLAGEVVDAFEGPAVGVEVPEVAGHGGGEAAYRVPMGGQGHSENGLSQFLPNALPSPACNGLGHPHPGSAASRCKGG